MKTALVHDYLLVMRGAERTFASMCDAWPDADVYTLLYDRVGTSDRFADRNLRSSRMQTLRLRQHNFRRGLPLFPYAAERLPTDQYDLVISSSSAFAHGVPLRPNGVHVCYCHSPFRYAWHERAIACSELPIVLRPVVGKVLDRFRRWDVQAARRVTAYIANSEVTRQRIQDYYGRDAVVVHPPVQTDRFTLGEPQDYTLIVTELARHKRVALSLEAARRAGYPVKVVGAGPEQETLKRQFGGEAEFLGRVTDAELARLYAGARVFVMASVEEFGIAAVEAQAAGRPVVAAARGGALETVIPGTTGVLVPEDDVDAMAEAIRYTNFERFSPERIKDHAAGFSVDAFQRRILRAVESITRAGAGFPDRERADRSSVSIAA